MAITFPRQNDAGSRVSNTQYWENLVLVVGLVSESKARGPKVLYSSSIPRLLIAYTQQREILSDSPEKNQFPLKFLEQGLPMWDKLCPSTFPSKGALFKKMSFSDLLWSPGRLCTGRVEREYCLLAHEQPLSIVKSGRARGTREETQRRGRSRAARFARPNTVGELARRLTVFNLG